MPTNAVPCRIQLSRQRGFRLQEHSRSINGLDCVNVSRPGPFGNYAGSTKADFDRDLAEMSNADRATMMEKAKELRGKNVACWCGPGQQCHGDTWLELAKAESSNGQ